MGVLAYIALRVGYIFPYRIHSLPYDVHGPRTLEGLVDWAVEFHDLDSQDLADGFRRKAEVSMLYPVSLFGSRWIWKRYLSYNDPQKIHDVLGENN